MQRNIPRLLAVLFIFAFLLITYSRNSFGTPSRDLEECPLNEAKNAFIFNNTENQCSVAPKEIPIKYASSCLIFKPGSVAAIIKLSYPDFLPIPNIRDNDDASRPYEKGIVYIELTARECDQPPYPHKIKTLSTIINREENGKKIFKETSLGNNLFLYERIKNLKYDDLKKVYFLKNNRGDIIRFVRCNSRFCNSQTNYLLNKNYSYHYMIAAIDIHEFLGAQEKVENFVMKLLSH